MPHGLRFTALYCPARWRIESRTDERDPRVPLVLRVEYPGRATAVRDVTENLSAGGLFIRTDRELAVGDRGSRSSVSFPGLLEPLEVEVEVVRRRAGRAGEPGRRRGARSRPTGSTTATSSRASSRRRAPARGPRGARYRVLVVEDNPHVVEMYEYALRKLRTAGAAGWRRGRVRARTATRRSPGSRAAAARPRDGRPLHAGDGRVHAHRADARRPGARRTPSRRRSAPAARGRARPRARARRRRLPPEAGPVRGHHRDRPHAAPDR